LEQSEKSQSEDTMKTLVVGTGIIGIIYGWALSEADIDVTHFVRKGKRDQFRDGVTLDLLDEREGHRKYYNGPVKPDTKKG
jgi:ketopantoate reductase